MWELDIAKLAVCSLVQNHIGFSGFSEWNIDVQPLSFFELKFFSISQWFWKKETQVWRAFQYSYKVLQWKKLLPAVHVLVCLLIFLFFACFYLSVLLVRKSHVSLQSWPHVGTFRETPAWKHLCIMILWIRNISCIHTFFCLGVHMFYSKTHAVLWKKPRIKKGFTLCANMFSVCFLWITLSFLKFILCHSLSLGSSQFGWIQILPLSLRLLLIPYA